MANEVEITVKGNDKSGSATLDATEKKAKGLGKALDQLSTQAKTAGEGLASAGADSKAAANDLDATAAAAKNAGDSLTKVGTSADSSRSSVDGAGQSTDKLGGKLDSLGERADVGERRITGVKDTIEGLGAVMAGPGAIGTDAYLQGLADLSSGVAEGVVPALQLAKNKLKEAATSALDWAKTHKGAVLGAAAAGGILITTIAMITSAQEEQRQQAIALGKALQETGFSESALADRSKDLANAMGESGLGGAATHSQMSFAKMTDGLVAVAEESGVTGTELEALQEQQQKASDAAGEFGANSSQAQRELSTLNTMVREATGGLEDLADGLQNSADISGAFNEAQSKLIETMFGNASAAMAADQAQLSWNDAIGNAETSAIDLATAGQNLIATQAGLGASGSELAATTQSVRDQFINAQVAAGMTAEAAHALANRYGLIPADVSTAVQMTGYENLLAKMQTIAAWAATGFRIPVNIQANNLSLLSGAWRPQEHGGIVGSAASGGVRSDLTMVGEHGRELVDLPPGSRVHSNPDTERMMAGGGSGVVAVHLTIDTGGGRFDRLLLEALREAVQRGGGVKATLGRL